MIDDFALPPWAEARAGRWLPRPPPQVEGALNVRMGTLSPEGQLSVAGEGWKSGDPHRTQGKLSDDAAAAGTSGFQQHPFDGDAGRGSGPGDPARPPFGPCDAEGARSAGERPGAVRQRSLRTDRG